MLRHVLIGFGITMLVLGFSESSIYALLDAFDKPATFVSVIVSVQGVGAIAGGLTASAGSCGGSARSPRCVVGWSCSPSGSRSWRHAASLWLVFLARRGVRLRRCRC